MTALNKQALREGQIEWLKKLADMEYCKSNPGHWLMSLKGTNMLAQLALRSVALLDENLQLLRDKDSLEAVAIALRDDMRDAREKLEAAENRMAELEARPANPINFKENADADYCRGWAWNEVKKELSPDDWTVGDNCTYYGFFCWGWDSRRQFNEIRAAGIGVKGE